MADAVEAEPPAQVFLLPCAVCGRTFRPESLQKHSKVCERNATKKRKIFDSSKQRIQGTELAEFLPALHMQQAKKIEKCRTAARQKSQWKEKHLEFMRAIRAARQVEKPLSPRASAVLTRPPESERCPHCDRQFGPKAFDRHIEWCREQKARVPKSPASIKAKERLEARLKYRAPVIRRISIREKYSPQAQRKVSDTSVHNSTDVIQSKSQAPSTMPSNSGQQDTLVPRQKSPSNNTQCNRSNITSTRSKSSAKKISQRSEPDVKKSPNTGVKSAISERKQISSQTNKTKAKKEEKTIINNQPGISRGKRPATLDNKPAENSKSAAQPNKTENDNAHSHRNIPCQKPPVPTGDITSAMQVLALDSHGEYIESPNIERFNSVNCKSHFHIKSVNVVDYNERKLSEDVISDETAIQPKAGGIKKKHCDLNSSYLENTTEVERNVDTDNLYFGIHEKFSEHPKLQLPCSVTCESLVEIQCDTPVDCNGNKVNDCTVLPMTSVESSANVDTHHVRLDIHENISEHPNFLSPCSVNNKSDVKMKCRTPVDGDGSKVNDSAILPMTTVEAKANVDTAYLHLDINERFSKNQNLQSLCSVNCESDVQIKCDIPVDCNRSEVLVTDSIMSCMTDVQYKANITDAQCSGLHSCSFECDAKAQRIVNTDSLNVDIHELHSTPPSIELCQSFNNETNVHLVYETPLDCCEKKLNSSVLLDMTHIQAKANAAETQPLDSYSFFSENEKEVQINDECSNHLNFSSPPSAPASSIGSHRVNEGSMAKPSQKMFITEELPDTELELGTFSVTSADILDSQEMLNICNEIGEYLNTNIENYVEQNTYSADHEVNSTSFVVSAIADKSKCENKDKDILSDDFSEDVNSQKKVLCGVSVDDQHHDILNTISVENPSSEVIERDMNTPLIAVLQKEEVDDVNTIAEIPFCHYTDSLSFSHVEAPACNESLTYDELNEIKSPKYQLIKHRSVPDLSLKLSTPHFKKSKSFSNFKSVRELIDITPDKLKYNSHCVKNDDHVFSGISKINRFNCIHADNSGFNTSNTSNMRKCLIHVKNKHIFNRPGKKNTGLLKKKYGLPTSSLNTVKKTMKKIVKVMHGKQNITISKERNVQLFNVNKIKYLHKMFPDWNVVLKISTKEDKDIDCNQESSLNLYKSSDVHSENNTTLDMDKQQILRVQQRKGKLTIKEASASLSLSCLKNSHFSDEKEAVSNRKYSEVFYTSESNKDSEKMNDKNLIPLGEERLEIDTTYQDDRNQNDNNNYDMESNDQEICFQSVSQNDDTLYADTASRDVYEDNLSIVTSPGNKMVMNQNQSNLFMGDNVEQELKYSSIMKNAHITQTKICDNTIVRSKVYDVAEQNKNFVLSPRDDKIPIENDRHNSTTNVIHKSNDVESELQQLYTVQSHVDLHVHAEDSSFHENSGLLETAKRCSTSEQHNEAHIHSAKNNSEVFTDNSNTPQMQSISFVTDFINANVVTDYPEKPCAEESDCKISFSPPPHNVNALESEHRICLEWVNQEEPISKQLCNGPIENCLTDKHQLMANKNVNNNSKASQHNFESPGKISDWKSVDDGAVLRDDENNGNKHTKNLPTSLPHLHPRQTERTKCKNSQSVHREKTKVKQKHADSSIHQDLEYSGSVYQDHPNESTQNNEHIDPKVRANTEIDSHCGNEVLYSTSEPAELQLPKIITTGYRTNSNKNVKELTIMEISKKHDKLKYHRNVFTSKIPRHVPNIQCSSTTVMQQCFTQDRNMKLSKLPPLKRCSVEKSSTEEVYNPFVSAERQMMELLADDGPVTPKVTSRVEVHSAPPYPKQNPTSLPTNNARAGLHSAPVAHKTVESNNFTHNSSSGPSESSLLNSSTEDVNSSLTPPMGTDCTYDTLQSPPVWSGSLQELDDMLNHGIIPYDIAESLYAGSDERGSSLSLCSLQFLDHMSSQESSSTRKISKIRAKMEEASLQLQKSVALHDSSTELTEKPNDRFKGFSDNDNLPCSFPQTSFFLSRPDPNISTDTVSLSGSDGLVSRKLYGDLDCESESGEKEKADEVIRHNSQIMKMNLEDDIYCKENVTSKQYSATGKHSVDSAYSSLNRQSPKQYAQEQEHCNAISSSGSESSLPTLCKEEVPRPGTGDTVILSHNHDHKKEHQQGAVISHLPKFCHECGAQYPVSVAKFCCECGVRRLLI